MDCREKPGNDERGALRKVSMTGYLISLALAGLVTITVWEAFS
jgi:hypothetical protein